VTGVDHRLERIVRAEMGRLRRHPKRSQAGSHRRLPVARTARPNRPVRAHVDRVGGAVPVLRQPVAWLYEMGAALFGRLVSQRRVANGLATPSVRGEPELPR
jgi:hypothetical protein